MTKRKQEIQVFNFIILIIFSVLGCSPNMVSKESRLELQLFSLEISTPGKNPLLYQSIDGFKGEFLLFESDTVYFNFGYDIDNLAESDPAVVFFPYNEDSIRKNLDTSLVDPKRIVYTKKTNFDIDEFRKQNVYFEMIYGYIAKITLPRKIANGGLTGVYVDSLKIDSGGRLKFNLFAKDLDSLKQVQLLKSIRSIRFKVE